MSQILGTDTSLLGNEFILNSPGTKAGLLRFVEACHQLHKSFPHYSIKLLVTITSRLPLAPDPCIDSAEGSNLGYITSSLRELVLADQSPSASVSPSVSLELISNTRHYMDFSLWSWVSATLPTIKVCLSCLCPASGWVTDRLTD